MEIILTGDMFSADEAKTLGLVSKVFEPEVLVEEAIKTGNVIAGYS